MIDVLGDGVQLIKVKGHATEADIDNGLSTNRQKRGNDSADTYAVRGTDAAEDIAPTKTKLYQRARSWYRYLLTVVGDLVQDTTPYDDWNVSDPAPPKRLFHCTRCTRPTPTPSPKTGANTGAAYVWNGPA